MHAYEVRPRKDKRGVDLISDALPFGRLWYDGPNANLIYCNAATIPISAKREGIPKRAQIFIL